MGLKKAFNKCKVKDIKVFCLLDKPMNRNPSVDFEIEFSCFKIPDYFIVGYGLDLN